MYSNGNNFITRQNEVIMFSPGVFVCLHVHVLFVYVSRCLSWQFNYEELVPNKQYFSKKQLGVYSSVNSMCYTLMTLSMTSPSQKLGQILKIAITPYVFIV